MWSRSPKNLDKEEESIPNTAQPLEIKLENVIEVKEDNGFRKLYY